MNPWSLKPYPSIHTDAYLTHLIYQYGGSAVAETCEKIARSLVNSNQAETEISENLAEIKKSDLYARFWWELKSINKTEDLKRIEINEDNHLYDDEYYMEVENLYNEISIIKSHINRLYELTGPSPFEKYLKITYPLTSYYPPTLPSNNSSNLESRIKYFQNEVPAYISKNIAYFRKELTNERVTIGCLLDFLEELDKLIQTQEINSKFNTTCCKIINILQKIKSKEEQDQRNKDLIRSALSKIPKQLWIDWEHCEEIELHLKEAAQDAQSTL